MTHTPLIEVTSLGFENGNRVFAKCENHNPVSSSHYDRVYDHLFDYFMRKSIIIPGKTHLIETSSGNAGTAFAKFCEIYGFDGTVVFPHSVRSARLATIVDSRVNVVVSDNDNYMKGALRTMLSIVQKKKNKGEDVFILNHSQLWESVIGMKSCGLEIISQFKKFGLRPDYFVSALGNGTSTSGIGFPLKQAFGGIKVIGFEPASSPVFSNKLKNISGFKYQTSEITGTGVWGIPFPNLKLELLEDILLVEERSSKSALWQDNIPNVKSLFGESIGYTSAVALEVAKELAKTVSNKVILTVFYDVGTFY